ncbi:hypothetical protein TNCV_1867471 [Trichonephila clavipes]|nr:hypothetical protein TNCV_1867471 [Trichonephila clavipes]
MHGGKPMTCKEINIYGYVSQCYDRECMMRYDRALRHSSSIGRLETFRSIFAATSSLVGSNSWDDHIAAPSDPRYAQLETNLGIGQAKKG